MRGHFSSSCSGSAQDLFCNLLVSFPQQSLKVKGGQRLDDSTDLSQSSAVNKVTEAEDRGLNITVEVKFLIQWDWVAHSVPHVKVLVEWWWLKKKKRSKQSKDTTDIQKLS